MNKRFPTYQEIIERATQKQKQQARIDALWHTPKEKIIARPVGTVVHPGTGTKMPEDAGNRTVPSRTALQDPSIPLEARARMAYRFNSKISVRQLMRVTGASHGTAQRLLEKFKARQE